MLVFVVRHAIAVPHGTPGVAEDQRPLTHEGIRKMRRIVRGLFRLEVHLHELWTSPLPRARQTAEILAGGLSFAGKIREVAELQPGADFTPLAAGLEKLAGSSSIGLVGHEPDLGKLTTWLLTGSSAPAIRFKKGGVACLELEPVHPPAGAQLLWMLTPDQASRIATKRP